MANTFTTPNMTLVLPTVGQQPWTDAANNINDALNRVDQHDHSSNNGVKISQTGITISGDLPYQNNNLTLVRSVRFTNQSAALSTASDLGCLYEVNNDLYYNDGVGNQIRITQSGNVVGSSGTISGLPSVTASASYSALAATFVWQSATSTSANMDAASYIFRNLTANSKGLTLNPPSAMAADFALTLPSLPSSQKIMTLDNAGAMAAPYTVDGTTVSIAANVIGVPNGGINTNQLATNAVTAVKILDGVITTAKIVDSAVTAVKLAPAVIHASTGSGSGTVPVGTTTVISGTQTTISTIGRPVVLCLQCTDSLGSASVFTPGNAFITFFRANNGGAQVQICEMVLQQQSLPPSAFNFVDITPPSGSNAYQVQIQAVSGNATFNNIQLIAYQI